MSEGGTNERTRTNDTGTSNPRVSPENPRVVGSIPTSGTNFPRRALRPAIKPSRPSGCAGVEEARLDGRAPAQYAQLVTNLQMLEEFRKLPVGDKASLLDALWVELAADTEHAPLSDSERAALDRRLGEVAQDVRPDRNWDELRSEFLPRP